MRSRRSAGSSPRSATTAARAGAASFRRGEALANTRVVGIVTLVGALALGAAYYFRPPETLVAAADACLNAIEDGDAGALMRRMSDNELDVLSIGSEELEDFLIKSVRPAMSEFERVGTPVSERLEPQLALRYRQRYRNPDGREATLVLYVSESDSNPRLLSLTADLYEFILRIHTRKKADRGDTPSAVLQAEAMQAASDLFAACRMKGYAERTIDATQPLFLTWEEAHRRLKSRAMASGSAD